MADVLREDLLQKLNDLVEELLRRYTTESPGEQADEYPEGSLAALARNALEADIHTGTTDTAERSREILNTEFADYLKERMNRDASSQ